MKKKQIILLAAIIAVVIGIGAYAALDKYLGNNVEIESVMAAPDESGSGNGTETQSGAASETAGAAVTADQLNGAWNIASGSKVYWSVTTSKETVNFMDEAVTGAWTVDLANKAAMSGEGVLDIPTIVSTLDDVGYGGWIAFEDESPLAERDPDEAVRRTGAYVRRSLMTVTEETP